MKTQIDGFAPAYIYPVEVLLEEFKSICRRIEAIEAERDRLVSDYLKEKAERKPKKSQRSAYYARLATFRMKLSELYEKKERIKKELAERMEIPPVLFADDEPSPMNECVGYCYGKCIYVDDQGDLRYREIEREGAESIGEPTEDIQDLKYVYELPEAEMKMILDYLRESPDTPAWVKVNEDN